MRQEGGLAGERKSERKKKGVLVGERALVWWRTSHVFGCEMLCPWMKSCWYSIDIFVMGFEQGFTCTYIGKIGMCLKRRKE